MPAPLVPLAHHNDLLPAPDDLPDNGPPWGLGHGGNRTCCLFSPNPALWDCTHGF